MTGPRAAWGFEGDEGRAEREQGTGGASLGPGGPLGVGTVRAFRALTGAVACWTGAARVPGVRGRPVGARVRLDWRRTFREAGRRGASSIRPVLRPRTRRPAPLLVLWDVSGSMGEYVPLYLPWLAALANRRRDCRVFAFGAEWMEVTARLRRRQAREALRDVGVFGGGTAIGRAVEALLEVAPLSGALVVIISDGWEGEPVERLRGGLAQVRDRARRMVWVNPLMATPGYEPVQRGIRTALRYVDRMVAGNTYQAIAELGLEEA